MSASRPETVASDLVPETPHISRRHLGSRQLGAGLALGCSLLIALGGYAGAPVLALAVFLVLALLVWGWPVLLQLPAPRGSSIVLALAAAGAVVAVAATRTDPLLAWLPLAIAGGVLAVFAHQLLRRDGRPRLVDSVSGEAVGLALVLCAAPLVALPRAVGGAAVVLTYAVAVGSIAIVELVSLPERLLAGLGTLAAIGGGALAAGLAEETSAAFGAVLGLAAAVLTFVVRRLFLSQPTARQPLPALSLAVAPIAAGGIAAYVLGRLFVG